MFVPFHYGYWDADGDEHHRAANELTVTAWDPVSKQPMYKYAAVQVTKVGAAPGDGKPRGGLADLAAKALDRVKETADQMLTRSTARGFTCRTR